MILSIVLIVFGFFLLIKGADFLVEGSSNIAKKFHIPEIIIGLTIVSIGTSMPELFISITSALNNYADMSIGNVIGSNLCNLLLILGLAAIIRPVKFKKETRLIEIPMCLTITIIFAILCNTANGISKIEAIVLLTLFVAFIIYTIVMAKKGEKFDGEESENNNEIKIKPMWQNILYIILGAIGLKIGGDLTVDNAVIVAQYFNLSEKIISLTILALGTSLPELVTSATASIKGNGDIAIGNILGSNIFNMLLIIGTSALIRPISFNASYNLDLALLIISTLILSLFQIMPPKNEMNRPNGVIYLGMYILYVGCQTIFI